MEDETMLISSVIFQIQRVESFCILLQGVITRQRELYSRSMKLNMSQDIVDDVTSPRGLYMSQGAAKDADEDDTIERELNTAEVADGANRFTLSMGGIELTFLYSMVWGLGGGLTGDQALAFDVFVRDLLQVNILT